MQHQLWVARQSVLRRLGSREDACVVSSDAELDAKLELFRSISESSALLQRLAEQQRERATTLANEELALGGFLREASSACGGGGGAASKALAHAGKAVSFVGTQRGAQRAPLVRLQRELDTFRARGVSDTRVTVANMERARQSYRAALSWMKAASSRLDPDSGAGLHQFRKAQAQVRQSKANFDKLTLDCLQKVDLLAAARCNMFSHVLVNYHNSFTNFTSKAAHTLDTTARALSETPSYEFSILKELSQGESEQGENSGAVDKDQMLFFQDEFKDENDTNSKVKPSTTTNDKTASTTEESCSDMIANLIDSLDQITEKNPNGSNINPDLAGLNLNDSFDQIGNFMPSHLLQNLSTDLLQSEQNSTLLSNMENATTNKNETSADMLDNLPSKKPDLQKKDRAMWFKLFAELDPLANPDAMPGVNAGRSHEA